MSFANLDFLNKNSFRKYPFRGDTHGLDQNLEPLDLATIVDCKITILDHAGTNPRIYMSKLLVKESKVFLEFKNNNDNKIVGYVSATIVQDYQVTNIQSVSGRVAGTVVFGLAEKLRNQQGVHTYNVEATRLEDRTIIILPAPNIKYINVVDGLGNKHKINGHMTLTGDNVIVTTTNTNDIELRVEDPYFLSNSGSLTSNTCGLPVILKLNSVYPDNTGNIDIYGIEPVQVAVTAEGIQITTPNVTVDNICPQRNVLYPADGDEEYYTDIITADTPEWKTWNNIND